MTVKACRSVTVGVSNLERALHLFRDVMALRPEHEGPLGRDLLDAWKVPVGVTARGAVLSCKGYPFGQLQLVEYSPTPTTRVRVDFGPGATDSALAVGPKAIDFYVADPIGPWLERVTREGYVARSAPRRHVIGRTESEEAVLTGPDDLPILLMVGHRHFPTSMRAGSPDGPFSEIATSSIVCGDLAAARRFYGEGLGLGAGQRRRDARAIPRPGRRPGRRAARHARPFPAVCPARRGQRQDPGSISSTRARAGSPEGCGPATSAFRC